MYMDQKNDVFFNFFFFGQMTPNTYQGYFSVELGLFYYILKKKDCVFESDSKLYFKKKMAS